jgi:type I restriction enzyme, R subunit
MIFNEDSRVKIPALVHLTRLGYDYIPKLDCLNRHQETNIFPDIFKKAICKINDFSYTDSQISGFISDLNIKLDNNDTGKSFYRCLAGDFTCKLIDFNNFENNVFNITTELTCKNGEDEFRPDITILINGMPLVFIEVKKPNNAEGILAERNRINSRFKNPNFKKFMNITQLLIFSNNQEYDDDDFNPLQGAFYATPDTEEVKFNFFREEDESIFSSVQPVNEDKEKTMLLDNNLVSIIGTPEYNTNKSLNTPTNRIVSSLLKKERLGFILKYGIAYVKSVEGIKDKIEKHIMRYPQLFATFAIENKLKKGVKKGIIWHTQGSGKTALAFYNVYYLKDFYQRSNIITKFYFIVDRLDLAEQAKNEFLSRGLKVELVNSKDDFAKNIQTAGAITGNVGDHSITVVNIQKFSEESVSRQLDYNVNIQRIYFLDEVHRSYNPRGSFLANLVSSDRAAVMIGLSGTPLIKGEFKSKDIFGDYIHKYYYNRSIADKYTLRLLREGIETRFHTEINQIYNELVKKGEFDTSQIYAHKKYVGPLIDYIVNDFLKSRIMHGGDPIGCMIVCDSSGQAEAIFEELKKYKPSEDNEKKEYLYKSSVTELKQVAEESGVVYGGNVKKELKSALILHDTDTKQTRKDNQLEFKHGNMDILIVYNMLLTGFDAPRLKKLYLLRKIDSHNLLQTLTRVNRPYKKFRYGYVVDFADIRSEFERTNRDYMKELNEELGVDADTYSNLFKDEEEIKKEIAELNDRLFAYNFSNVEEFQKAISVITERKEILDLKKSFDDLRSLFNIIKMKGYESLLEKFNFNILQKLYNEVLNRLNIINLKYSLENSEDNTGLLNIALEEIRFTFKKVGESELKIADEFMSELGKTRGEMERNFDKKDQEFVNLMDELKRIFKKKNIEELTSDELSTAIDQLKELYRKFNSLNNKDNIIALKYLNDEKFVRIHKRIKEKNIKILSSDTAINEILLEIKKRTDNSVINNVEILNNQDYFTQATKRVIIEILDEKGIRDLETIGFVNEVLVNEYFNERAA